MPKLRKKTKPSPPITYKQESKTPVTGKIQRLVSLLPRTARSYWQQSWWHKFLSVLVTGVTLAIGLIYGIGQWYIWTEHDKPFVLGTSFVADYATSLGLDPHHTLLAILDDLKVRHVRLISYWNNLEPRPEVYDFSELDWEFEQAASRNAKVSLAVGLRQPRWPECHMPLWAMNEPISVWQPQLESFMTQVINRYKNKPALESYQLENEYFLTAFAVCSDESRQRLIDEANLVHRLDPHHTLIIARSQNDIGWPIGRPTPDEFGISIYQRVWTPVLGRYIQYPWPTWYYAFLAGIEKVWSGRDMVIHELQAEPWPPYGIAPEVTSITEQDKSFNAERLNQTVTFGKGTGMKNADLWGAEYWYYRKTKLHDPSIWIAAQAEYRHAAEASRQ